MKITSTILNKFTNFIDTTFLLNRKNRFDYLEGLRGIAVLMVFLCHFFGFFDTPEFISSINYIPLIPFLITFFHNGQIGVDLFFVLSGFFIARNLKTKTQSFSVFIWHRLYRLIPVHFIVLVYFIIKYNNFSLGTIISNIFFINGFIKDMQIINIVTWSLSYELLFYVSFGLFIVISKRVLFLQRNITFFYYGINDLDKPMVGKTFD